ncbi:unnamed protein product, partial [Rotaria magnacalcarata]
KSALFYLITGVRYLNFRFFIMRPKKLNNSIDESDRELIQALELDGKRIENLIKENVEKLDRMLDDDLFNQTNLNAIQSLARESVVNVPALIDNKLNDDKSSLESHLVIKSNERLEILVERVKHE